MTATRRSLAADLAALGLAAGDSVLVHAGLRAIGPIVGGPDMLLAALGDAVGPAARSSPTPIGRAKTTSSTIPSGAPIFRPSIRDLAGDARQRLLAGTAAHHARRAALGQSRASMAALGGRADWFTAEHALDYGYGPDSPLGKLVEADGKTLLIGCPWDRMTLLHHAEHLADYFPKHIRRYETPVHVGGRTVWRWFEEFDTSHAPEGLPEDYFVDVVAAFLASGKGRRGTIGAAPSLVVSAPEIVPFAVRWLETRLPKPAS